ncbi:MAG: DUF4116 domain-containing protein, partial [Pseudomonadota bacterium]
NDGILRIHGNVDTALLLNDDHDLSYGKVTCQWAHNADDPKLSTEHIMDAEDECFIPPRLRELLSNNIVAWEDLFDEVCSSAYMLKANASKEPVRDTERWYTIVTRNKARLRSVPAELITEDMARTALSWNGGYLQYVPEAMRTPELCHWAVQHYFDYEDYEAIPEALRDEGMLAWYLRHNGFAVSDIPEEQLTPALAAAAVCGGGGRRLPDKLQRDEVALKALETDISALDMPPAMMTPPVYEEALRRYGEHEQWAESHEKHAIPDTIDDDDFSEIWAVFLTENNCLQAVEAGIHLGDVPPIFRTKAICEAAMKNGLRNFPWVPPEVMTASWCKQAVKQNGLDLRYIPSELHTDGLFMDAVIEDGRALQFVPQEKRSLGICNLAMDDEPELIQYVPETLRDKVFEKQIQTLADEDAVSHWYRLRAEHRFVQEDYEGAWTDTEAAIEQEYHNAITYYIRALMSRERGDMGAAAINACIFLALRDEYDTDTTLVDIKPGQAWIEETARPALSNVSEEQLESLAASHPTVLRILENTQLTPAIIKAAATQDESALRYVSPEHLNAELFALGRQADVFYELEVPEALRDEVEHILAMSPPLNEADEDDEDYSSKSSSFWSFVAGLLIRPALRDSEAKGLVKWFVERPSLAMLSNSLIMFLMLILHCVVTYQAFKLTGWLGGLLTLVGLWFAEFYWAWREYGEHGVTLFFGLCVFIATIYPIWNLFFNRVQLRLRDAYGFDEE